MKNFKSTDFGENHPGGRLGKKLNLKVKDIMKKNKDIPVVKNKKKLNFDYEVPLLDAQFVNLEQGTGIVHIAPGHGDDDYNLGIKYGVDVVQTVQDDGRYNHHAKGFENDHIYKVDDKIAEKLKEFRFFRVS